MDHVDWLDTPTVQELASTLAQQVLPGGIVIWRSASLSPPYSKVIKGVEWNGGQRDKEIPEFFVGRMVWWQAVLLMTTLPARH